MATRFNSKSRSKLGVSPLPTGYESQYGKPEFTIPSCGLEDVDVALFELFDKEISPMCGGIDGKPIAKVPIIFAAGEKWAMLKRGRPLRDRNNSLVIPLITIMRTEVTQDSTDVVGRGISQQTGEIVIRRRLDKSDRDYQALINKFFLRGQANLAAPRENVKSGESLAAGGKIGSLAGRQDILTPDLRDNVWETIVVPSPQFYTVKYQVTVWTQYMQHSNQILEKLFASYLPQAQSWRLDTPKGYWFVATTEGGNYAGETNFEDMGTNERFIKHNFTVSVPAYFFATSAPGAPVPLKRYVSSPIVQFDTGVEPGSGEDFTGQSDTQYVLGADDPTLPRDVRGNSRPDQRPPGWRPQKVYPINDQDVDDPAIDPLLTSRRRIKEVSRNRHGETVYTGATLGGLQIVIDDE